MLDRSPIFRICLFGIALLSAPSARAAEAGLNARFGQAPYQRDASVIGLGGWTTYGLPADQEFDPGQASIVDAPWDESRMVLALRKNHAGGPPLRLKATFPPVQDAFVLEATLAFDFPAKASATATSINFEDTSRNESVLSFGMSYGAEGGLFCRYQESSTSKQSVAILPKAEVKPGSPYRFALTFRPGDAAFDLAVSGVRKDGSPFAYKAENLAFTGPPAKGISALFLENIGPNPRYAAYAEEIVLQPLGKR